MFLTLKEIQELTGRKRRDAQIRELTHLGVTFDLRSDGSIVVLTAHVEKKFAGAAEGVKKSKQFEPNWGAI